MLRHFTESHVSLYSWVGLGVTALMLFWKVLIKCLEREAQGKKNLPHLLALVFTKSWAYKENNLETHTAR